ncbi:MAG: response regulator, partial [Firmicutes bacterium]|nr:response regulator [Bacillota bacterium]
QITTAKSGMECLEKIAAKRYDIVFLDHMMPEMDGIETLHNMRRDEQNQNIGTPTICLTANAISGAREEYLREGFDDYLTKPIDADALEKAMINYLPKDKVQRVEKDQAEAESGDKVEIPSWIYEIVDIDADKGVSHCGSPESYLETLAIYGKSAPASADEIENLWAAGDLANTTVKVHAIKSLSRAIGAEEIGALAEKLELAGKAGETEPLENELPGLLSRIRAVCSALTPLVADEEVPDDDLPEIDQEELQDAYCTLKDVAESMDAKTAQHIIKLLSGYKLPEADKERVAKVKKAIESFDWGQISEILK